MKHLKTMFLAGFSLVGASTLSNAQVQPVIDCSLPGNMNHPICASQRGAVVNHGTGAVGTIGTAENPATVGIGGSGSVPPPAARVGTGQPYIPPAPDARRSAVVPHGSGSVGTLGPAESTGSVGVGGSGAVPPPGARVTTRPIYPPAPGAASGAVVNRGTGAVNPLGPAESPATSGIGGSGTTAPIR